MLGAVASFAETIYFKDGKTIEGQVTEKTDRFIKVNIQGVTLTYYLDEIARVGGDALQKTTNRGTAKSLPLSQFPTPLTTLPSAGGQGSQASSGGGPLSSMGKQGLILALIEASGTREQMNQIFSQILTQAPADEAQQFRELINIDEMVAQLIPVYEKYFTEDELRGLMVFYQSPLGRKLLTATPLIMQESMQASMHYLQSKFQAQPSAAPGQ